MDSAAKQTKKGGMGDGWGDVTRTLDGDYETHDIILLPLNLLSSRFVQCTHLLARDKCSETRGLNLCRLLAAQQADERNELRTDLVANLVRTRGVEHEREHVEQLVEVWVKDGGLGLEQVEDCTEDGPILEVVVPQGQRAEEDGQHLVERDRGRVLDNHPCDGTNGVVARVQLG